MLHFFEKMKFKRGNENAPTNGFFREYKSHYTVSVLTYTLSTTKLRNSQENTADYKEEPSLSTVHRNSKTKGDNCCRVLTASDAQTRRSKNPLHCRTLGWHPCARLKNPEKWPASHWRTLRAEQHQPRYREKQSRRTINAAWCPASRTGWCRSSADFVAVERDCKAKHFIRQCLSLYPGWYKRVTDKVLLTLLGCTQRIKWNDRLLSHFDLL